MNSGVVSMLCLTGLLILFWTGWFPELPADLRIPRPVVSFGLILALLLTASDPMPLRSMQLHPGLLIPAALWLHLLLAAGGRVRSKLFHAGLLIGFFLFFRHEGAHVQMGWEEGSWGLMNVLIAGGAPVLAFDRLDHRLAASVGSLIISHAWILLLHHEALTPTVLGAAEFLDALWLTLGALVVFHHAETAVRSLFRKRRRAEPV